MAGRPLKFETPEELDKKIDAYFELCKKNNEKPMITGLAVYLDTSRETLREYKERPEFVYSIKKALDRCEMAVEKNLLEGKVNPTGSIFVLKNNYGWRDKTEQEMTVNLPKPLLDGIRTDNSVRQDTETEETN
jgi:hypothetical protein